MSMFWNTALSLMDTKHLRQVDVARALKKSKTTVYNWITRDTLPQADDALAVADLLGVSVRYLVLGVDDEQPPLYIKELVELAQGLTEAEVSYFCDQIRNYRELEDRKKGGGSHASDSAAI